MLNDPTVAGCSTSVSMPPPTFFAIHLAPSQTRAHPSVMPVRSTSVCEPMVWL